MATNPYLMPSVLTCHATFRAVIESRAQQISSNWYKFD